MSTKSCRVCDVSKPLSEYYAHPTNADGYLHICKECHKSEVRARSSEYIKTEGSKQARKAWAERYPERRSAGGKLSRAVAAGAVIKTPCHICGEEKSEAHHADYSRPLDVVWLCRDHHKAAHALVGKQPSYAMRAAA